MVTSDVLISPATEVDVIEPVCGNETAFKLVVMEDTDGTDSFLMVIGVNVVDNEVQVVMVSIKVGTSEVDVV